MVKGENIIEGYCKTTGVKITQADIRLRIVESRNGDLYFLHHLPRGRELLKDMNLVRGVTEAIRRLRGIESTDTAAKEFRGILSSIAEERGITLDNFEYGYRAFMASLHCKGA